MFESGAFKDFDIGLGVIDWGGWTELLPDEIVKYTTEVKQ